MPRLPLILILCLILFSGCIESLSPEKRLYCLDLTEKSYAFVPDCDSEQSCFSKVDSKFFGFDESVFSNSVQTRLYSYKNNVALSWLYFNKARKSISSIHEICLRNNSLSQILFHLNELSHSLAKAFEFGDKANRESFAILILEEKDLMAEDINLVKEEPLFNDFSLISSNLSQFGGKASCSQSQSYACFYLKQTESLASLIAKTGFEGQVVSEVGIFDLLNENSEEISKYNDSTLKIPFIGPVLQPFLSFIATFFTSSKAIELLEKAPAFEFLQSFNAFMGTENSCLSKFSTIMESDSIHRQQLIERNQALEALAEKGISEAEQNLLALLSENYTSFDQNFFQRLYSGLGQESNLAAQRYSIQDFGQLRNEAGYKLALLKQNLLQIKQEQALNRLSLGEKASSLKQLNQDISLLQENLDYVSNEVTQGLLVLCRERASFIEQSLEEAVLPQDFLVKAADLKARAGFKLSLFNEAEGKEQQLLLCSELVQEFDLFSLALKDFEQYQLEEELSLEECFSFLNRVFGLDKGLGFDLSDFRLRFHELQAIEKPYQDLAAVRRNCLMLQTDLEAFLRSQPSIKEIEESFSSSQKILSQLLDLNLSKETIRGLESQLSTFEEFFEGDKILLEKSLPLLPDLETGLKEFSYLLEDQLDQAMPKPEIFEETESLSIPFSLEPEESLEKPAEGLAEILEDSQKVQAIIQKIDAIGSNVEEAGQLLALLEGLFSNVSDEQLISSKYVLPISRTELDKIGLNLASLRSFLGKKQVQDFLLLALQSDFNKALEKSSFFEADLGQKLDKAQSTLSRLENAFNAIKEDAVVSYNSAADLYNTGVQSKDAEEILEQAKDALLKGKFLESIVQSKKSLSLISQKPVSSLDLPIFVWPIAIGSALVLAVRFKKKGFAKQREETVKRIEKNW